MNERGAVSTFLAVIALALLMAAGLAIDGGRKVNALREASHLADNAARAGAQAVDLDTLRTTGDLRLLPSTRRSRSESTNTWHQSATPPPTSRSQEIQNHRDHQPHRRPRPPSHRADHRHRNRDRSRHHPGAMMRHLNHLDPRLRQPSSSIGLVFVVGVPVGLVAYVGWPLPSTIFPHSTRSNSPCASGIDPQLLINTLAVIVWVVWAQLAIALTAEAAAAVRGRAARRLPVLPGLQPAVAQLVAAVTLAAATLGPLRTVPAAAAPLPAEISLASSYPVADIGQEPARPGWAEAAPQHAAEP